MWNVYLCTHLAGLSAFTAHVYGEAGEQGGTLNVIVVSGSATVNFLDISRGIKLVSRDETCTQRGVVRLRNDAYPELQLDQIEVHHRDLISPAQAMSILCYYLNSGETIELVPWPSDDEEGWGDSEGVPSPPGQDIPF